jgi:hypothetical protein
VNRADRKKQLIAEGVLYRAEVMFATQDARDSLRPDTLARSALHQAMLIGLAALKTRSLGGLPGMNLMTLLPLAVQMLSSLSRRKGVAKVVLGGAALAGTVAGAMRLFSKTKKADDNLP